MTTPDGAVHIQECSQQSKALITMPYQATHSETSERRRGRSPRGTRFQLRIKHVQPEKYHISNYGLQYSIMGLAGFAVSIAATAYYAATRTHAEPRAFLWYCAALSAVSLLYAVYEFIKYDSLKISEKAGVVDWTRRCGAMPRKHRRQFSTEQLTVTRCSVALHNQLVFKSSGLLLCAPGASILLACHGRTQVIEEYISKLPPCLRQRLSPGTWHYDVLPQFGHYGFGGDRRDDGGPPHSLVQLRQDDAGVWPAHSPPHEDDPPRDTRHVRVSEQGRPARREPRPGDAAQGDLGP
jgi:hypothetical protein